MHVPHPRRNELVQFLKVLRDEMVNAFEKFESSHQFIRKPWDYQFVGGGEMSVLRGDAFEKAAVNWSGVGGPSFPMADGSGPFFATGVSLITHMTNPHAPTAHFNIRFIETKEKFWFAGGYDLTPMGFAYDEDTQYFHETAKESLKPFGEQIYEQFSQNARQYFYIPHRKKERGVGGIFFDAFNTGDFEKDVALWKAVANSFLKALLPIYDRRVHQPYSPEDKDLQQQLRAHYVEFNLLYDRGTRFGFQSGGNPEAILCSMPPFAKW